MNDQELTLLASVASGTARLHEDFILSQPKYLDERSITGHRAQMYSQNGEDGAIAEIFRRIGSHTKRFVEIGAGDGVQNNTRFLFDCGWSGLWWEADAESCAAIRRGYAREISQGRLVLREGLVTRENVAPVLREVEEFDLLSIDIDMNTSHIWRALSAFEPRVVVIEYNSNIPPAVSWEVAYREDARWLGDSRFGASLKRLEEIGGERYRLVGCELTGINAFFVRADLVTEEIFLPPFTAQRHYEPPRFHFLTTSRGHLPSNRGGKQ